MQVRQIRTTILAIMVAGIVPGGPAVSDETSAALETYREFVSAWESAADMRDLYPFLQPGMVEQFEALPPERQAMIAKQVLNPRNPERLKTPAGGFYLVSASRDDDELDLVLGARRTEEGKRIDLRQKATLVPTEAGWKVDNPTPEAWRAASRMPVDMKAPEQRRAGPGARAWTSRFDGSFDDLELVAQTKIEELNSAADDFLRWDPKGHFLAVGETDGATYLSLPELEPLWVSGARNSGTLNMSISHDGVWQLVAESYPALLPLAASLERRPPAEDYFFTQPDFVAISRVADRVRVADMAFHPAEPVIAIVNRERDSHSVYFQTTQGLVSGDAASLSGDPWASALQPTRLAWSGSGDHLAYVSGFAEAGSEVVVREFPTGETAASLSADGFMPGNLQFSADEAYMLVLGGTGEGVAARIWDLESGEMHDDLPTARYGAWAPDSRHLFLVEYAGMGSQEGVDNVILLGELGGLESAEKLDAFPRGDGKFPARIQAVSVSPNGRYLAATAVTYSSEGEKSLTVKLWQIAGGS